MSATPSTLPSPSTTAIIHPLKVTGTFKAAGIMENAENNDNMENSKFVEFWVPVQLSNVQLEQYCATLLSKSMALCSSAKRDPFETLKEVFVTNRKCCNHPYMVDFKLQDSLIKDKDPSMILDIDIKASGKLHFLDRVLPEIKKQQLKVVILFQPTSGGLPAAELLVDYVHQRFGLKSYEQLNGVGHVSSKKQAAINMFNTNKSRFILLLESRACHPSIKLSSVDVMIIFDSNLNPHNDLKSLQKISFDSQSEQIMIFRLFSKSTLEEKILKLAENNMVIDIRSQNPRSNYDAFLTWGASDLFHKLSEFHRQTVVNISSEESNLLQDAAVEEFLYIISHKCKSNETGVIIQAQYCGIYSALKVHLLDGDQPYVLWRKLLDRRFPTWKFVSESTSRKRKRPGYSLDVDGGAETRSKTTIKPAKLKTVSERETAGVNEGVPAANDESHSPSGDPAVDNEASLHDLLKPTVSELCNMFKLSEDVKVIVGNFLEFVLEIYEVGTKHTRALQAFMISLCWIGSSVGKYRIDRSESFALAKKRFNFSCMEEEANVVYRKLEGLKELFLESLAFLKDRVPDPAPQNIPNIDTFESSIEAQSRDEPVCEDTCERENVDATASIGEVPAQLQVDDDDMEVDRVPDPAPQNIPNVDTFENSIEAQSRDEPVCKDNSERENVDATASIGEVPAQLQVDDDDMEVDVADSRHENAKSIPDVEDHNETGASDNCGDMEMQAGDYNIEIGEKCVKPEVESAEPAGICDGTDVGENQIEISPNDVLAHVEMAIQADNEENTVMRPDALHASEDHNDFCGSNSSNPVAVSSVQPVSFPASDHIIPEIKNKTCQREQLPDSGVQDEEIKVDDLQQSGAILIILDDELDFHASTVAENPSVKIQPLEPIHEEPPLTVHQDGVEQLYTVRDNVTKFHQEMKQNLDSECEKEIAKIRLKYKAKHLEADAAYNKKNIKLETNIIKRAINESLVDAFLSMCQHITPSGHPGMQQVSHVGLVQQPNMLSSSPMTHLHGVTSSSLGQSSGSQQPLQPPQPLPQPLQQPQIVHQPAALFSSRPPSTTPYRPPSNTSPSTTSSRPPVVVNQTTSSALPTISRPPPIVNKTISSTLPTTSRPPPIVNKTISSTLPTTSRPPIVNQTTSSGSQQPLQPPQPLPQPLQQPQPKLPLRKVHQPADLFSSRPPFTTPYRPPSNTSLSTTSSIPPVVINQTTSSALPTTSRPPPIVNQTISSTLPTSSRPHIVNWTTSSGSQQPLQPPQPLPQPQPQLPLQIVHKPADLFSSRSVTPFISPGRVQPTSLRHEPFTVPPSSQPCTVPSSEPLVQSFDNLTGPIDNAPCWPQPDIWAQFDNLNIIDLTQEGASSSHDLVCLSDDD